MLSAIPLTIAALMLVILFYFFLTIRVGGTRAKYGVEAPAVTGNEIWERYFRVQMNTLEQMIALIPAALAFATFWGDLWGAIGCVIFLVGRIIYYVTYVADPKSRAVGALMTFLANLVLVIGALIGAVLAAL